MRNKTFSHGVVRRCCKQTNKQTKRTMPHRGGLGKVDAVPNEKYADAGKRHAPARDTRLYPATTKVDEEAYGGQC